MKKLVSLLIIFWFIKIVSAGYISMVSNIRVINNSINVEIINRGNEPAYDIKLTLSVDGFEAKSNVWNKIYPYESLNWNVLINKSFKKEGSYPLVMIMEYRDANFYPYSAISATYFIYKADTKAKISAKLNNVKLSKKGVLELLVRNDDFKAKDVKIKLVVPKEFDLKCERIIKLKPKEEKKLKFPIKSKRLANRIYPVFALLEYEDDKHHSLIVTSTVSIVEKRFNPKYFYLTAGILICLLIIIELKGK